jgi:hypothetical protein
MKREGDRSPDKKVASTDSSFNALKQEAGQARLGKWGKGDSRDARTVAKGHENRDKLADLAASFLEENPSQRNTRTTDSAKLPSSQTDTAPGASKGKSFAARIMELEEKADISPAANRAFRDQFSMNVPEGSDGQ